MRIRSAALLLALVALVACAAAAQAAALRVPLAGVKPLTLNPPVALPAASPRPPPAASRAAGTTALPHTGIEVPLIAAIGSVMLLSGLGLQTYVGAHRRRL